MINQPKYDRLICSCSVGYCSYMIALIAVGLLGMAGMATPCEDSSLYVVLSPILALSLLVTYVFAVVVWL